MPTTSLNGRDPWDWAEARRHCLRAARGVLGPSAAAEDAVQEALLRAWLKRASCRHADRPLPWLARIARNEALRLRLREAERAESPIEEALLRGPADADGDERAAARIDARRLLDGLPPVDRELVRLHYFEDLTQAETASRLGIPGVTAKVRLHRLRLRLRDRLGEDRPAGR